MVAGAIGLAARLPPRHAATVALVALAVQGAGMAAQTAWAILPVAFAGYAVGGLGHGVKNTLLRLAIQQRVPAACTAGRSPPTTPRATPPRSSRSPPADCSSPRSAPAPRC